MLYPSRLKMIQIWFLLILSFLVPLSVVCAADDDGKYKAYGLGLKSCGLFVEQRRKKQDKGYVHWVEGYLTAVNMHTPTFSILGTTDIHGAMLLIENYCIKNPLKAFGVALDSIFYELFP